VATENGYSRIVRTFDANNNQIERAYFGTSGQPIAIASEVDRAGFEGGGRQLTYASLKREYESGHLVAESYFDVNGKPTVTSDNYASWRATFDRSGNRIEVAYFGLAGQHVKSIDGYAGWRTQYNALGRRTKVEYFGERGEPVLVDGRAAYTIRYDAQGNEIETVNLDADGHPVIAGDYAILRTKFDRRGNAIENAYLDGSGHPVARHWDEAPKAVGYARETRGYDERNRMVEHAYYGVDGARVSTPMGWSRVTTRYELRGKEPVEVAYYDTADHAARIDGRYHTLKRKLDPYGRVIEETYFDEQGKAARTVDGYAKTTLKYDSYGHEIEQAYFGESGAPLADQNQIHRVTMTYDDRGRRIEVRFFGLRDEPIRAGGTRQHLTRYSYDARGLTIEIANFDIDSVTPALGPDMARQRLCTRWTGSYDADGKLVRATEKCESR
jgi:YD repeat-containing protein